MMTLFMGPLNFYKLAYTSVMMTCTLCSLVELSNSQFRSEVKREDFEYLLTWEAGNNTEASACYTVLYTANSLSCPIETESDSSERHKDQNASFSKSRSQQSENPIHQVSEPGDPSVCPSVPEGSMWSKTAKKSLYSNWKAVVECSNISRLFCDLTKEFTDPCKEYKILVVQVTESGIHRSLQIFNPYINTCIGLPQFNISACPNCVNVTVKLSSSSLVKVYEELDYTVTVAAEGFPNKYSHNKTREESFYTVIRNLHPNRNHCITVDISTTVNNKQCTPSSPKCIIIKPKNQSDLILPAASAGILMSLILTSILLILYNTGFICLRKKWPKVLKLMPILHYSVFKSDPEETHNIQVTQENKKKVWEYDDEEEEDSGSDVENAYTIRRTDKISRPLSVVDSMEQLSSDHSSAISDTAGLLAAEPEVLQNEIDKGETVPNKFFYLSEMNSAEEPESYHSNVNLNSVKLGISDKNWDVVAVLSDQEDPADLKELCISRGSESTLFTDLSNVQTASAHNISLDWQKSGESGESESSDSETDNVGDYMRR